MTKRLFSSLLYFAFGLTISCLAQLSCTSDTAVPKDLSEDSIIPMPTSLTATGSSFELTDKTDIYIPGNNSELEWVANYLADLLNPSTGLGIAVKSSDEVPLPGNIQLILSSEEADFGAEGYAIDIVEDRISLTAHNPAGLFYAIQTLRHLLPAEIEMKTKQEGPWLIATGTIQDAPSYAYRGTMLDVARHFFEVKDVKRFIDLIAIYKMNVLHLHLSDDQGWRIEIKSWPNLATHGGSTEVGGESGGYYTQEQYTEIVQYAQDRFITIVPEIDMPGHTNAALASYAELNCDGKARELYTGTEVGFSTLCTDKEITYQFVDDVIKELAAITPGPYIHIGGDESHATPLEDYIPFVNKVQKIVASHGKQVIGWDEIANAELLPNSIVQYWAEADNAKAGIAQGAKVIMSPATKTYLDMQYDSTTSLGLHWAAYIELDSAYNWNMETMAEGVKQEDIIGIESPLWSETITNIEELEYMVFPRLPGHAEIGWTPSSQRNWEEYKVRLGKQQERFETMGINYYPSKLVPGLEKKEVEPLLD